MPSLQEVEDRQRKESVQHPRFNEMWAEYRGLVYWWAHRCVKYLHAGESGSKRDYYQLYLGALVLRLNRVLYDWDASVSKFSTYYSCRIIHDMRHQVYKYLSIRNSLNIRAMDAESVKQAELEFATHEKGYHLYRVPEADWATELITAFDTTQELWDFVSSGMRRRDKYILLAVYKYSISTPELCERLNVSKQRINQILDRCKLHIRGKAEVLQSFMNLFTLPNSDEHSRRAYVCEGRHTPEEVFDLLSKESGCDNG